MAICEVLITQRSRRSGGSTISTWVREQSDGRCQSTEFCKDLMSGWKPFTGKRPSKQEQRAHIDRKAWVQYMKNILGVLLHSDPGNCPRVGGARSV